MFFKVKFNLYKYLEQQDSNILNKQYDNFYKLKSERFKDSNSKCT